MNEPTTSAPPRVAVAGYTHVNLPVDDLDAALGFWRDLMGFEPLARPDFGLRAGGAWLRCGDLQLHLSVCERMPDPRGAFPHTAFHVPADRWDETVAALEAAGVPFLGPPRSREDFGVPVRTAFCTDPCGNVVELTDVGPLPPRP